MSERIASRPSPSGGGRAASRPRRRKARSGPVPAMVAAAIAIPMLVTGFALALRGWYPTIDEAYLTTRAYDVWTARAPLLGPHSLSGGTGPTVHSPGPTLYWLVSIPARLGPPWMIPVFMAIVSAVLLSWVVVLARRRGGNGFMWVTAVGLVLLVRALGPAMLVVVWNPWAALVPFTALVFVCWSVADGERRLLPIAVLLASFSMQAHLTYGFPSVALLVVAVAGGWGLDRRAGDGESDRASEDCAEWEQSDGSIDIDQSPTAIGRSDPRWTPFALAALVGLACWVLPLYQQFTGRPGNVTLIARASGGSVERGGARAAMSSLWRTVGLPPKFARPTASAFDEVNAVAQLPAGATVGTVVAALVLVGVLVMAVRRHDRTVISGVGVVGALLVGVALVADKIPLADSIVAPYTFRWFAVASLMTWLVVALAVARLVPAGRLVAWTRRAIGHPPERAGVEWASTRLARSAAAIGALALLVVGLAVPRPDPSAFSYRPGRRLAEVVLDQTESGGTYLVDRSGPFAVVYAPAAVWALRSQGRFPIVAGWGDNFGSGYGPTGIRCDGILVLASPTDARRPGARTLARIAVKFPPKVMRVDLVPDRTREGSC